MNYSISGVGGRSGDGRHPGSRPRKKGPPKAPPGGRVPVKFAGVKGDAVGLTPVLDKIELYLLDTVSEMIALATFKLNSPDLKRMLVEPDGKRRFTFDMIAGDAYADIYRADTASVRDLPRAEAFRFCQGLAHSLRHTSGRDLRDEERKRIEQDLRTVVQLLFGPTATHVWEVTLRDTGIGGYKALVAMNADTGITSVMVRWND